MADLQELKLLSIHVDCFALAINTFTKCPSLNSTCMFQQLLVTSNQAPHPARMIENKPNWYRKERKKGKEGQDIAPSKV